MGSFLDFAKGLFTGLHSQASIARGGDAARSDCLIEVADMEQVAVAGRLLDLDLIEVMGCTVYSRCFF